MGTQKRKPPWNLGLHRGFCLICCVCWATQRAPFRKAERRQSLHLWVLVLTVFGHEHSFLIGIFGYLRYGTGVFRPAVVVALVLQPFLVLGPRRTGLTRTHVAAVLGLVEPCVLLVRVTALQLVGYLRQQLRQRCQRLVSLLILPPFKKI